PGAVGGGDTGIPGGATCADASAAGATGYIGAGGSWCALAAGSREDEDADADADALGTGSGVGGRDSAGSLPEPFVFEIVLSRGCSGAAWRPELVSHGSG